MIDSKGVIATYTIALTIGLFCISLNIITWIKGICIYVCVASFSNQMENTFSQNWVECIF